MPSDGSVGPVSIRPYRRSDLTRCAAIYVASRRVAFPWVPPERFSPDDFLRDTREEEIAVAEGRAGGAGTDLLGFVSVFLPGRFIHHLYVDPEHRRSGVGRLLVRHAIGIRSGPWRLKCVEANAPAMAFYQSEGWVEEGRGSDDMGPHVTLRHD